ncbi:B3 domain-containing protein [Quillaja saponaria]|uniref:B3 domain-containing protein n=1 Tax=Quillaja saponaria TaxID=32244 RepID=A0AAD7LTB9_QUISA|nr:B3 domain-containing protein [Quillaja saponaria]
MAANSKKRVETKEFHRRQRCFPESRSTHFFKILLPFTIEEKKLRIPEKFIHEFGDKLSDIVTLSDPNCRQWKVGRPYHHKSKAFTKLPDRRTLRKNYNPPTKSSFGKKRKRSAKTSESEHGDSDTSENEFKDKQEEEHVDCHLATKCCSKSYKKKRVSEDDRDKVISAADDYKTTNPSFKVVLKPHNIYNSFVYVPAGFGLKYFKHESINVVLLTSKGRKWQARCFYREGSGCGRSIGKGFAQFSRDNNLEEGDVCVFELIDKKKFMLEVTIFRLDDYVTK